MSCLVTMQSDAVTHYVGFLSDCTESAIVPGPASAKSEVKTNNRVPELRPETRGKVTHPPTLHEGRGGRAGVSRREESEK